ncbi:MAG: hypothetical protein LH624_08490, partial [Cryobacterium sp.]|nr:hypothetical protein [Cryobacterium sp.]
FTNGRRRVSATLLFNERDEMVDFWSDDRPDSSTGTYRQMRWNTPVGDYRDIEGRRLATAGAAVYAYPEGSFAYGEFTLRSLRYDLEAPGLGHTSAQLHPIVLPRVDHET